PAATSAKSRRRSSSYPCLSLPKRPCRSRHPSRPQPNPSRRNVMGREPSPRPEYKAAGFTDDHHTTLLGAAYGMRHFRLDQDGYLVGLTYRTRWVNGVNQAECYNPRRGAMKAPGAYRPAPTGPEDRSHSMLECGCGWWA